MNSSALLSLLQLTDPALPIGGFSHSYGLETYVQTGIVYSADTANNFITKMLSQNICYTDAAFASLAFDAAKKNDLATLISLDEECTAVKLPREIREASQKLGLRLLKIFSAFKSSPLCEEYMQAVQSKTTAGNYCVVFGLYAALSRIPKADALTGFYYNSAAGMVTNCVKLIPLGQQDGQQILFSLRPLIAKLVTLSLVPDRNMIGYCCAGFDIRSMQHEQLYSRLYMS